VIIPTYNEASWLEPTIIRVRLALDRANWDDWEMIVVDDGSTDGTVETLAALDPQDVRIVHQQNSGRMVARRRGLAEATGELVLFIDSRVWIGEDALRFVRQRLELDPTALIWNGHAVTASTLKPWTRFWDALTFLAWRRYLRHPTTTSYGDSDFDYFPKGTTMFLAPREWLIAASDGIRSRSADPSVANDDTLLIHGLLRFGRINISPEFDCRYHPRTSFRAFLKNAYHRGAVFVDGHLRPGKRFHRPFQILLAVLPAVAWWAVRRPRRIAGLAVGGSAALGVGARALGVPSGDAASLAVLAVPFSVMYAGGIVKGFRVRRRAAVTLDEVSEPERR
jgi:glycosyltransferase involved in cell wall biosynthesis